MPEPNTLIVQYHFVCEWVQSKEITFQYLPTVEMPADILTKALAHPDTLNSSRCLDYKDEVSGDKPTYPLRGSVGDEDSREGVHVCAHERE